MQYNILKFNITEWDWSITCETYEIVKKYIKSPVCTLSDLEERQQP
jgi:hypothetical protein